MLPPERPVTAADLSARLLGLTERVNRVLAGAQARPFDAFPAAAPRDDDPQDTPAAPLGYPEDDEAE